jgi:hypothetical protein
MPCRSYHKQLMEEWSHRSRDYLIGAQKYTTSVDYFPFRTLHYTGVASEMHFPYIFFKSRNPPGFPLSLNLLCQRPSRIADYNDKASFAHLQQN